MRRLVALLLTAAAVAACVPAQQPEAVSSVSPTECKASLLRSGSALAEDVAALGRSMACTTMASGTSAGMTLIAEGAVADASQLKVIVIRSAEPLGTSSALSGSSDAFVSRVTGGSDSGAVEPVPVPATTTIGGHDIALEGFSIQRGTDPARHVCVAASDRTSAKTIAAVCRSGAGRTEEGLARAIIAGDLPGIQW